MATVTHLGKGSKIPEIKDHLVLYSNVICPFAQRAHLVLSAKKVPYETVYMDLWNKAEWYKDKNPTTKVPALGFPESENKEPVIESLIIADYLDEKYPEHPLNSKDPYQKARDQGFIERFNNVLSIVAKIMYPMMRNHQKIENVDEVAEQLFVALDPFEKELEKRGSKYFGGDKPGMMDYMIWPWCERTIFLPKIDTRYDFDEMRFKHFISWRDLMCKDNAVKASYLSPEFYYEFHSQLESNTLSMDLLNDAAEQREKGRQSHTN